jgi:hypothetical protein
MWEHHVMQEHPIETRLLSAAADMLRVLLPTCFTGM